MKRYPLLEVCARIEGHTLQHQLLRDYCLGIHDWQALLARAELEGMAPLLRKHLLEAEADIPLPVLRSLNLLYIRHQQKASVRIKVLEELLNIFRQHQVTAMLIKGAALCQSLYPDSALRPMRDMDIFFSTEQVDQAQELLRGMGFEQSVAPIPLGHYHLLSLHKKVDNVQICIELHQGLYSHCPPYYPEVDFTQLLATGQSIRVGKTEVSTFSHEETLHYLYQHGLRAPLTYETYKLINIADIIGFTEKHFQKIDWVMFKRRFPGTWRALPMLDHISPWNLDKIEESYVFPHKQRPKKLNPAPFHGWPQRRVRALKDKVSLGEVVKETFFPSIWWLRMYYGTGYSVGRFLKGLCWDHPSNVFWWAHVYSHFVYETETASSSCPAKKSISGSLRLFLVSAFNKIRGVIRKIISL